MTARVLPYGPGGWLVEVADGDVVGYAAAVLAARHPGVAEVVPAARTVLVRLRERDSTGGVGAWLASLTPAPHDPAATSAEIVEIPVVYDGEDLDVVAAACGLTTSEVAARHAAVTYRCAFCGFAPGFAYLTGLDPTLRLARRATPRTRVPAGSVAIAAEFTAVYPATSPGGWHLLGRTAQAMWDPAREPPAIVSPGTAVRFVAADR